MRLRFVLPIRSRSFWIAAIFSNDEYLFHLNCHEYFSEHTASRKKTMIRSETRQKFLRIHNQKITLHSHVVLSLLNEKIIDQNFMALNDN